MLTPLLNRSTPETAAADFEELKRGLPNFPLQSAEEVVEFNSDILHCPDTRKGIISVLASYGGNTPEISVTLTFVKLFDDNVARYCSWCGDKQQMVFQTLVYKEIIFAATKLIPGVDTGVTEFAVGNKSAHGCYMLETGFPIKQRNPQDRPNMSPVNNN